MIRNSIRSALRNVALRGLSVTRRIDATSGWIRMPYYHHVHNAERAGFARQLDYLRQFGDFISLDQAARILDSEERIDGRYFCLTFDDGFRSCVTGAYPILAERSIPAAFYVVTDLIGRSLDSEDPIAKDDFGYRSSGPLEFLSWDDCRDMIQGGMIIGSHTATHFRLSTGQASQVSHELARSKQAIESAVGRSCEHFCAPYGTPGLDYLPDRDRDIARGVGYKTFATGRRGANRQGSNPLDLSRDHLMADWGLHQLRYFFSS